MRVSWFATAGPDAAGVVHFWIVLRDSRGGVDFAGGDLMVE
jgi:hypothetical protein